VVVDRPYNAAFSGTLPEVAAAVAAQPNPGFYDVRFHRDGFARASTQTAPFVGGRTPPSQAFTKSVGSSARAALLAAEPGHRSRAQRPTSDRRDPLVKLRLSEADVLADPDARHYPPAGVVAHQP
jgi:hypothetical protein